MISCDAIFAKSFEYFSIDLVVRSDIDEDDLLIGDQKFEHYAVAHRYGDTMVFVEFALKLVEPEAWMVWIVHKQAKCFGVALFDIGMLFKKALLFFEITLWKYKLIH